MISAAKKKKPTKAKKNQLFINNMIKQWLFQAIKHNLQLWLEGVMEAWLNQRWENMLSVSAK